jgi:regulator of cell morphogenesis and NO signaling
LADHERWRKRVLPEIDRLLAERARIEKSDSVFALRRAFGKLCQQLESHLGVEERVLFPALLDMDRRLRNDQPVRRPAFGSVKNPITMIQREHEDDAELWSTLEHLAALDATSAGATEPARRLYQALLEFEAEVRAHTEVENTVLFPRALELEKQAAR